MSQNIHFCAASIGRGRSGWGGALVLLLAAAVGCSSPPDTSPAIRITSPGKMQVLPVGMKVDVRFDISGVDSSGPTMVPFKLKFDENKVYGQGQVVAYFDGATIQARTTSIPDDKDPFFVPGPQFNTPMEVVTAGMKKITLKLQYNDGSTVEFQQPGEVTVLVQ